MSQTYKFKNVKAQKYVGDTVKVGTVELTVDWDAIVQALGTKAAFNRSGKSKLALGIKAKFIEEKQS